MKDAMCSIPARFVAEQVGQRTTQLRAMQNEGSLVDAIFLFSQPSYLLTLLIVSCQSHEDHAYVGKYIHIDAQ